ncbi:hypothetical protein DM02DRAFT_169415 [Periconia macrospinosa]|uniref:C2H2-type domain-containing protein n=1 Tax=Periconia macrospinosa TaxID=97972 RepID=A0A2V1DC15_9PLEO|nr:hypothetical protein DM02DRAFT_169415 [Periconia macrospinosa]
MNEATSVSSALTIGGNTYQSEQKSASGPHVEADLASSIESFGVEESGFAGDIQGFGVGWEAGELDLTDFFSSGALLGLENDVGRISEGSEIDGNGSISAWDKCFEQSRGQDHISGPSVTSPACLANERAPTELSFRTETETRTRYICTTSHCGKKFSRLYDLRRHHRSTHQRQEDFWCQMQGCKRAIRGFARKDKRDSHEQKMHHKLHA